MRDSSEGQGSAPAWTLTPGGTLTLTGDWVAGETGVRPAADIASLLAKLKNVPQLTVNTSGVGRWDSALVAFIRQIEAGLTPPTRLDHAGLPAPAQRLLSLAGPQAAVPDSRTKRPGLLTRVGLGAMGQFSAAATFAELVGSVILRSLAVFTGRLQARPIDILTLIHQAGANALIIVAIVNGLVGAIMAFVGVVQLRRFGAGIFVADLVGIATVREMAAVMTGIVMAGRTGGAYAAQLATMQGNEEIDALKVIGIQPADFLVLPRIIALVGMMPLLYLYACAFGLLGGFVVSFGMLHLSPTVFMNQAQNAVGGHQFVFGAVKSLTFGAMIALTSCQIGLGAGRSAAEVGRAATSAVVVGIVGVIALDAVFAVCADVLGV